MASTYTDAAAIESLLGQPLVSDLLDLSEDGSPDTNGLANKIQDVGVEIDGMLAQKYVVPFADFDAAEPTPPLVALLAKYMLAARLLEPRHELSAQRDIYNERANTIVAALTDGSAEIPGAAKVGAADAKVGFKGADVCPTFAGYFEDDDNRDRMSNW